MKKKIRILMMFWVCIPVCIYSTQEGESVLYKDIVNNNPGTVRRIVRDDPDCINSFCWPEKLMPIHLAFKKGFSKIVNVLIEEGANFDKEDDISDATPLYKAIELGWIDSVQLLIKHNAKFYKACVDSTPLHLAIENGNTHMIQLIIDTYGGVNTGTSGSNVKPLCRAIELGRIDIARLLICEGADINARNGRESDGPNPLEIALQKGYQDIIQLLINNNVKQEIVKAYYKKAIELGDINQLIDRQTTPHDIVTYVNTALEHGFYGTAKKLIQQDHHSVLAKVLLHPQQLYAFIKGKFASGHGYYDTAKQLVQQDNSSIFAKTLLKAEKLRTFQISDQEQLQQYIAALLTRYNNNKLIHGMLYQVGEEIKRGVFSEPIMRHIISEYAQDINSFVDKDGNTILHYLAHDPYLIRSMFARVKSTRNDGKDKNGSSCMILEEMFNIKNKNNMRPIALATIKDNTKFQKMYGAYQGMRESGLTQEVACHAISYCKL